VFLFLGRFEYEPRSIGISGKCGSIPPENTMEQRCSFEALAPPELKALRDKMELAIDAEYEAEQALLATTPTTLLGTLALLDYLLEVGPENINEVQDWIGMAAESLRVMA
jgi:hypothetical protein